MPAFRVTLQEVRGALKRGDLFFHGFPHNGEAAAFPDASLFDAALAQPQALAAQLGIKAPTTVSQRDVPGTATSTSFWRVSQFCADLPHAQCHVLSLATMLDSA